MLSEKIVWTKNVGGEEESIPYVTNYLLRVFRAMEHYCFHWLT